MGRPQTKKDLIEAATINYEKLIELIGNTSIIFSNDIKIIDNEINELIDEMTEKELTTPFDFSKDEKKKEAHWQRDKNLRDILIHLYEWHNLLLKWVKANEKGENKAFLLEGYNWKTYGEMNMFL